MKRWQRLGDLLDEVQASHARLVGGDVDVDKAHAEARILGVACKAVALRMEHARLTGRLEQGCDHLPDVMLTSGDDD